MNSPLETPVSKKKSRRSLPANHTLDEPSLYLLPPPAGGGGKGEGGRRAQCATPPTSPSQPRLRLGPSLSPLKGGEGLFSASANKRTSEKERWGRRSEGPALAVVIPVYKHSVLLGEAVISALNQQADFDLVIIIV